MIVPRNRIQTNQCLALFRRETKLKRNFKQHEQGVVFSFNSGLFGAESNP
jgi:hypothetical protein